MATHTFYLYRYQLLPITKQYDLRYDLDEIIRNKNEYFKNAILQLRVCPAYFLIFKKRSKFF